MSLKNIIRNGCKIPLLPLAVIKSNDAVNVRLDFFVRPNWSHFLFRRLFIIPFTNIAIYRNTGRM
jgi:hypothetical protein